MGFFSDIMSNVSAPVASESSSTLPTWYQQFISNIAGKGAALADQPYAQFPGQAIAGFTPQQQQAFDLTSQQVGAWQPLAQQAQSLIGGSSTYNPAQLAQFLSPYTSQVVEEIGRLGQRGLMEQALPQALAAFTGAGQFGSTRGQEFAGRTIRDTMADIAGRQGAALQAGWAGAQQQLADWASRGLTGAGALSNLAAQQQGLGMRDIAALGAAGQAQQQLGQQNLDWARQQFQEQQDYPWQQLGQVSSLLRGMPFSPVQQASTISSAGPTPSPFAQIVGGLSSYGGITKAKGGRVRLNTLRRRYGLQVI